MPELKPFIATNTFRTDDSGYAAYETLGRRVGNQYEQAGNDLRDIGRAKAATINMLGRWPFNILELEKRETERYYRGTRGMQGGTSSLPGGVVSRGRVGIDYGGTSGLYAPMRMPNLAALNEMSEGAGQFGRMLGGPSQLPYQSEKSRMAEQQYQREQDRKLRLAQDEWQKRWDVYEKGLDKYNEELLTNPDKTGAQDWYNSLDNNNADYSTQPTYGGGGEIVPPPDTVINPETGEYGGGGASSTGWFW